MEMTASIKWIFVHKRKQKGRITLSRITFTAVLSLLLEILGDLAESPIPRNCRRIQLTFQAHCFILTCCWLTHPWEVIKNHLLDNILTVISVLILPIIQKKYTRHQFCRNKSFWSWQNTKLSLYRGMRVQPGASWDGNSVVIRRELLAV